jgi:hypothetical protein
LKQLNCFLVEIKTGCRWWCLWRRRIGWLAIEGDSGNLEKAKTIIKETGKEEPFQIY